MVYKNKQTKQKNTKQHKQNRTISFSDQSLQSKWKRTTVFLIPNKLLAEYKNFQHIIILFTFKC